MNRSLLRAGAVLLVGFAAAIRVGGVQTDNRAAREWRTYGHDPGGIRFSPLTQITVAEGATTCVRLL